MSIKATNTTEFVFKPVADQTQITWSMFGDMNFMSKIFFTFVNHDRLLGRDFEKGLAQLKVVSESSGALQT